MHLPEESLRELLVDTNTVADEAFEVAATFARETNITLEQALREKDVIDDVRLGELVAKKYELPFVQLKKLSIPEEVLEIIPEEVARGHHLIAFERTPEVVKVATAQPDKRLAAELLMQKTGVNIELYYATDMDVENLLTAYRTNFQDVFEKLISEEDKVITTIANDPPVKKMVELIVEAAYKERASDVHIEPREQEFIVRLRVDGMLHDILTLPKRLHERVVTRIKLLSSLRTDMHLAAQDGKFRLDIAGERVDLRVSVIPVTEGEKVVMRLLAGQSRVYSLTELGMSDTDLSKLREASQRSFGMILVTGPTGSGKTTTIYSVLTTINTRQHNLTTIEDPVEYRIAGANQVQVNEKTNLTFVNGLRSLLRQDPDYIFVGEIRDSETASIAINAALTGHLVFSTLHTNNAAASLPRLYDMKVEPFLVASTVHLIIAQRLVRRICNHCRISEVVTVEELRKYFSEDVIKKHYIPVGKEQGVRIYKGAGCRVCHNTGYSGRIGIYEVLQMTKSIRELVYQRADADVILAQAIKEGMTTMYEDGIQKITKGLTTIEEIYRVTTTDAEL